MASLHPGGRCAGLTVSGLGLSCITHSKVGYAGVYLLELYLQVSVSNTKHSEMTASGQMSEPSPALTGLASAQCAE